MTVKAELQYQKLVLQFNSPLLRVTETLQQLVTNLKLFFGADEAAAVVPIPLPQR